MSAGDGAARAGAFFDLDRTLLADSSGLLVVEALTELGLLSPRHRLAADVIRRAYRRVGETWLGMQLTRRGVRRFTGWSVQDVRLAARRSVDLMDRAVYEEARTLIDRHRREGKVVCIATSTGREVVEPLAERLGVDHVVATEYETRDGMFTGRYIGAWLWGPDKAAAVRAFAEREGIGLGASVAYSDSYYDRPLLQMVGHPRAVNPDAMLRLYATRKGWPILEFRNSPDEPRRALELYDVLLPTANPLLFPINLRTEGLDAIPRSGGCILACNHRSYLDPLVLAAVAARRSRKLRYLSKKEVTDAPLVGDVVRALGQIRVERGSHDEYPVREATDALARGEAIGIFPQGTIPRGEAFFSPVLEGKTGVARLALASGAPVIPIALWGTERLWPRRSFAPDPVKLLTRHAVHVRAGRPMFFGPPEGKDNDHDAVTKITAEIMERIAELLPDDVRYPPSPSPDAIAAATPRGAQA
jgi:putative phosphoserine phosphatase/1-acylglycerol-3-phosphate O-acyltransferase